MYYFRSEMSYIISNQYVRIEPRAASIGPRIVAFILDAIFLFIFNMGLTTLFFVFVNDYVGDIWLVLCVLDVVLLPADGVLLQWS